MTISSLASISGVQQQNIQKATSKLGAAIAAIVSGKKLGDDVASLSVASQLQAGLAGLRQASGNLAQASSLAQVADGGLVQLQQAAEQIQTLAQTAKSPTLTDDARKSLDVQFKELVKELDRFVVNTSFNGKSLLNGDLSGNGALSLNSLLGVDNGDEGVLSIDNLGSVNLLGSDPLSLSSTENAANVFTTITTALGKIIGARANVGSFLQSMDYAAANVDTAVANQEAARSTLQDTDFPDAAMAQSQATLQQNASIALAAQGNRLTPALLKLVS